MLESKFAISTCCDSEYSEWRVQDSPRRTRGEPNCDQICGGFNDQICGISLIRVTNNCGVWRWGYLMGMQPRITSNNKDLMEMGYNTMGIWVPRNGVSLQFLVILNIRTQWSIVEFWGALFSNSAFWCGSWSQQQNRSTGHTHTYGYIIHSYIHSKHKDIYIGIIMVASMSIEVDDIYHRGMWRQWAFGLSHS